MGGGSSDQRTCFTAPKWAKLSLNLRLASSEDDLIHI